MNDMRCNKKTRHGRRASWMAALFITGCALVGTRPAFAQHDPNLDKISSAPIPAPTASAEPTAVLAAGETPLTQEMVDRYRLLFEWVLDAPTTQEQRQALQGWLVQTWKSHNAADIQSALNLMQTQMALEKRSDSEREVLRQQIQSKFLEKLRQQPETEASRWVFSIYDAAHKPIAEGNPPLTRQISDAYCEVLFFMRSQVLNDNSLRVNKQVLDLFAPELAKVYRQSNEERRKHFAGMPLLWASIRAQWPAMEESKRAECRKQWREYLQIMAPWLLTTGATAQTAKPATSTVRANTPPPRNSQEAYAREMARLQSSHQAYMFMSNMSTMSHVANMNAISNIGSGGWHYEYKYK